MFVALIYNHGDIYVFQFVEKGPLTSYTSGCYYKTTYTNYINEAPYICMHGVHMIDLHVMCVIQLLLIFWLTEWS